MDLDALFRHHEGRFERLEETLLAILTTLQEMQMSETQLQTDIAAQTAAITALTTEITNGLAANAAAIDALKAQIAAGSPITAADLASLESNTAAIQTATTELQAALNPAKP